MAVEERVIIKIDIDADISGDLKAIEARIKGLEDRYKRLGTESKSVEKSSGKVDKSMNRLNRTTSRLSKTFLGFFKTLGKFSFIGYALEVAVLSTALLGAKLAMATGRVAASAYQVALKGVAGTATAVASAVAVAAAAVRQFGEAQLAPFVGGNAQAATFMRGVNPQVQGLLGSGEASALSGQLGKIGLNANQSNAALTQLFNISAGDTKGISSLITGLSGDASGFEEALLGIGPQGAGIADKTSSLSRDQIIEQLIGGQLTPEAFQGFSEKLGATLIGTMKAQFAGLFNLFADLGANMVEPFRRSFMRMGTIVRQFVDNTGGLIEKFGVDSFAPTLVSATEKIANFFEKVMKDGLPALDGMGQRFSGYWQNVRDFFREMAEKMGPLEAGAEVLLDMLGAAGGGLFGNGLLGGLNELLVTNADSFNAFGQAIGDLLSALITAGTGDSLLNMVEGLTGIFDKVRTDLVPPLMAIADDIHQIALDVLPPIIDILQTFLQMAGPLISLLTVFTGTAAGSSLMAGGLTGAFLAKKLGGKGAGGMGRGFSRMAGPAARASRFLTSAPVLGTLLTGESLFDAWNNGDTSKTNVATGAAGGALLGTMILPGVGTAIGAVLGGAISLGIGAWRKSHREENAREFAGDVIGALISDGISSAALNTIPDLTGSLDALLASTEELDAMADAADSDIDELVRALERQRGELEAQEDILSGNLNSNLEWLTEALGKTDEEIINIANNLDKNLVSKLVSFGDAMAILDTIIPDMKGRGYGQEAISNSMHVRNQNALGARTTLDAMFNQIIADGDIGNFGEDFLHNLLSASNVFGKSDLGGNLDESVIFQNLMATLGSDVFKDVKGMDRFLDDMTGSEADVIRTQFQPLADIFDVFIGQMEGLELINKLSMLETYMKNPELASQRGLNPAQWSAMYGPGSNSLGAGGVPGVDGRGAAAAIGGVINEINSPLANANVEQYFNGLVDPSTLQYVVGQVRAAGLKAAQDVVNGTHSDNGSQIAPTATPYVPGVTSYEEHMSSIEAALAAAKAD
jgi:hypothetical protein